MAIYKVRPGAADEAAILAKGNVEAVYYMPNRGMEDGFGVWFGGGGDPTQGQLSVVWVGDGPTYTIAEPNEAEISGGLRVAVVQVRPKVARKVLPGQAIVTFHDGSREVMDAGNFQAMYEKIEAGQHYED